MERVNRVEMLNELANLLGVEWPLIICWFFACLLFVVELFTPGVGVPGVLGMVLLILGVIFGARDVVQGLLLMAVVLLVGIAVFIGVIRSFKKGRISRSAMVLKSGGEDWHSAEDYSTMLGKTGETLTLLRPAGTALIDGVRVDVVTEGEFLDKGVPIQVAQVTGNRIVVKQAQA